MAQCGANIFLYSNTSIYDILLPSTNCGLFLVLITANSCKCDNLQIIFLQCNFVIVAIFRIINFFTTKIHIFAMAVHYDFVFFVDSET